MPRTGPQRVADEEILIQGFCCTASEGGEMHFPFGHVFVLINQLKEESTRPDVKTYLRGFLLSGPTSLILKLLVSA